MILAKNYKKFTGGGGFSENQMGNVGFGTDLISGVADAVDPDGTNTLASALGTGAKFAGIGAQIGGPVGAGIGAVVGAGVGIFSSGKRRQEAKARKNKEIALSRRTMADYSGAQIAANPELVNGSLAAGYYKYGGVLGEDDPKKKVRDNTEVSVGYGLYSGIGGKEGKPSETEYLLNTVQYLKNNYPGYSNVYRDKFSHHDSNIMKPGIDRRLMPNIAEQPVQYAKNGGSLASSYLGKAQNGSLVPKSSDGAEVVGPSHAAGGVKFPKMKAELEGSETVKGDYVFSKELGFAKLHRPLMVAKGKIEKKALTPERANSMHLLESQENKLKVAQDYIRNILKIA